MLVLTRKAKQSIMIGNQIEITVLKIERDQVRIGIAAPSDVPVHRKEIYENIQKNQMTQPGSAEEKKEEPPPEKEANRT